MKTIALAFAALATIASPAGAQGEAEFYKGKTVTIVTSTGPGGVYDLVARLIDRHMPRHLAGAPSMIVQNMPGGGNVVAPNYMYEVAPKDGTWIAVVNNAVPLNQVLVALVTMLFGIAVFVVATLLTEIWIPPDPRALLWVFALLPLQALFTYGLGLAFATLQVYLRDTVHVVTVGLTVWMFATPIFYPAALVEKAGFGWMLQVNPMYWLIESYRSVICYGSWPDWSLVGRFAVVSALVLAAGASFFSAQKPRFPDLL